MRIFYRASLFERTTLSKTLAWAVFALGVLHIAFGLVRFKLPLTDAVLAGFTGQFSSPEVRRTGFWFLLCGPLLMLAGHAAVHAVSTGDLRLLRLIGGYLLVVGAVGVAAFPASPLWGPLLLGPLLIAVGSGRLG